MEVAAWGRRASDRQSYGGIDDRRVDRRYLSWPHDAFHRWFFLRSRMLTSIAVSLIVVTVAALVGLLGYLIEKSGGPHFRREDK